MAIIAGIDEAGYGPPLGPLVVSATVFEVPDEHRDGNLWKLLSTCVSMNPRVKRKLVVADSKASYTRSKGVGVLEETALCFLVHSEGRFERLEALLRALAGDEADDAFTYPWYREQDVTIPLSGRALGLDRKADRLGAAMTDAGVRFHGVRCLPLFEAAFNRRIDRTGNKSVVLFSQAARLISGIMKRFDGQDVVITVDKHGGRDHYGPMLGRRFKGARVVAKRQDREAGHYHLKHDGGEAEIRFVMHGERHALPVALASMFSKYVRELYMMLFNRYWQQFLPEVKGTAGYAQDARRFLEAIAPVREKLNIPDDVLVRKR